MVDVAGELSRSVSINYMLQFINPLFRFGVQEILSTSSSSHEIELRRRSPAASLLLRNGILRRCPTAIRIFELIKEQNY